MNTGSAVDLLDPRDAPADSTAKGKFVHHRCVESVVEVLQG
jgi:hypothetical protein